jgi:hypothetical protein
LIGEHLGASRACHRCNQHGRQRKRWHQASARHGSIESDTP